MWREEKFIPLKAGSLSAYTTKESRLLRQMTLKPL